MNDELQREAETVEKPPFGETCNGCGLCCRMQPCAIAITILGEVAAPCPILTFHDGRYWCRLVEIEDKINRNIAPMVSIKLGIGRGCDSECC